MKETVIRLAQKTDLIRINDIYNWAVENTVVTFDLEPRSIIQAEQWYSLYQEHLYPHYVMTVGEEIAGWGSLSPFHPRPAYQWSGEFSIYVAPEFQKRGLGDLLLGHLCSVVSQKGYHSLLGLSLQLTLRVLHRNLFFVMKME